MSKSTSLLEAAATMARFNRLAGLVDPANGAARWEALQEWLDANPVYRQIFEAYLDAPPEEALEELLDYLQVAHGITPAIVSTFDTKGELRKRATLAIERIQTLYKERQNVD